MKTNLIIKLAGIVVVVAGLIIANKYLGIGGLIAQGFQNSLLWIES